MESKNFASKGNLLLAKGTLSLSKSGSNILENKKIVLIKEVLDLEEKLALIKENIATQLALAMQSIKIAIVEMGEHNVKAISNNIEIDNSISVMAKSIIGTDIPIVDYVKKKPEINFSLMASTKSLDEAYVLFEGVKDLLIMQAMIENAKVRLEDNIKRTSRRSNALKNIVIPKYEALIYNMQNVLEEREREEFVRLKGIKNKVAL